MVKAKHYIISFTILLLILLSIGIISGIYEAKNYHLNNTNEDFLLKEEQISYLENKKGNTACIEEKCSTPLVSILEKKNNYSNNYVCVYIYFKQSADIKTIEPHITNVTNRDEKNNLIVGWVSLNNLKKLSSMDTVCAIRKVIPPEVNTGSMTSRGDSIHNTDSVREMYNQYGSGIKIGVISDSVDGLNESKNSKNLPDDVVVLSESSGRGEGTAILEIIHDMVPEAKLYFHGAGNNILDFNYAVDTLVNSGCKIIVDDIGWKREPFFEHGIVASHVANVVESNEILYFTAAGNEGKNHYQGIYQGNAFNFHNKSLKMNILPNESIDIVLQWNDRFGSSSNDYDLYLFRTDNRDILDRSIDTQNGNDDPLEYINYTNPTESEIEAEINIRNYNAEASKRILELYIYTDNKKPKSHSRILPNNIVTSDSIYGHPAIRDVVTVGAISIDSDIEPFSSQGPVTHYHPDYEMISKPDVVGVNGINVSGAGGFSKKFYGTSASAPHVAAVAAQLWSSFPSMKAQDIREAIYYSAVDMGVENYDYTYGYGRVDALKAYKYLLSINNSSVQRKTYDNDKEYKKFEKQETSNKSSMKSPAETQSGQSENQDLSPEEVETPGFGAIYLTAGLLIAIYYAKKMLK